MTALPNGRELAVGLNVTATLGDGRTVPGTVAYWTYDHLSDVNPRPLKAVSVKLDTRTEPWYVGTILAPANVA